MYVNARISVCKAPSSNIVCRRMVYWWYILGMYMYSETVTTATAAAHIYSTVQLRTIVS